MNLIRLFERAKCATYLMLACGVLFLNACDFGDVATKRFLQNASVYFSRDAGASFTRLSPDVFSYQKGFNRNLVLRTSAGFVVIDCFNPDFARGLADELRERFPGESVHTLIYSHYHLDHVRGGAELAPARVIGHRDLKKYWRFLELDRDGILPLTREINGDTRLNIGGLELRLLDMGLSHTDTLFAVHLPESRVLFAPDLGFVRSLPPAGLPDMYYPGYIAALERLAKIDFDTYVPSHFQTGKRADLREYLTFLKETRALVRKAYDRHGPIAEPGAAGHYYDEIYLPLKAKYGDWVGFDEMILPFLVRNFAGVYLGY
ncbi:MAG: MBL fold metallo-hydrolase [bacterium]|nr:MBL fold metallo-hydrolase [bacterium]